MNTIDQTEKYLSVIKNSFLFLGVDSPTVYKMLKARSTFGFFTKGQIIYDPLNFKKCLGIILSGEAIVEKIGEDKEKSVILNTLYPGQIFGAASVFNENKYYVTSITAKKDTDVIFIDADLLLDILKEDFTVVSNYIGFLSQRILFLNQKIDNFISSGAEGKLAVYLCNISKEGQDGEYYASLGCSMTDLSKTLNIGRASLYRAFESLTQLDLIKRRGKAILISNMEKLKEFTK